jgi:hypothetical protein
MRWQRVLDVGLVCSVVAALSPYIVCPCIEIPVWLFPAMEGGFAAWVVLSLVGFFSAGTRNRRIVHGLLILVAPVIFFVTLGLSVSH